MTALMNRPHRRPRAFRIAAMRTLLAFVLLGATVNVAIAWGSSVIPVRRLTLSYDSACPSWPAPPRAGWPDPPRERVWGEGLFQSWDTVTATRISTSDGIEDFTVSLHQSGWPARTLECIDRTEGSVSKGTTWSSSEGALFSNPALPIRPLWRGFAINTVFYASMLWLLFVAPFALRRRLRLRLGRCPNCAYPVGQSPVCTECGTPLAPG